MIALIVAVILGLPLCPTEDSSQCVWVAEIQGNGDGISFVDLDGELYRLP